MIDLIFVLIGFTCGFVTYLFTSHPRLLKNKFPVKKFGRLSILPHLGITIRKTFFRIHHWLYLSIVLAVVVFLTKNFLETNLFLKSILVGGIFQGLIYKNRFKFCERIL